MDEKYQAYINRVVGMTQGAHYQSQWQRIQSSPKFCPSATGAWEPVPFPGYTLTTPVSAEDPANVKFYSHLRHSQEELWQRLPEGLGIPLPPETFHLTIADLIWDGTYLQHVQQQPDYEAKLKQQIGEIFQKQRGEVGSPAPIRLQVLGFLVMTRAIGIALAPHTEANYDRIMDLRKAIYQNPGLLGLGIEQQYNFIAHVTLGYFGEISDQLEAAALSEGLVDLNQQFLEALPEFDVERVELRKFDNMTHFYRQDNWPILKL